ncbi:MAG: hypothetical protein EP343_02970 [Deltaproteobacteria bacterium]|nr:MAG: hypothetical protein EP343_02970 [Deltaproteobacteria bacterium]
MKRHTYPFILMALGLLVCATAHAQESSPRFQLQRTTPLHRTTLSQTVPTNGSVATTMGVSRNAYMISAGSDSSANGLIISLTLLGLSIPATLIVGNSVAYHTKASNRMAWGISGMFLGALTIAIGAGIINPKTSIGVGMPILVGSMGVTMFGLGVTNIHSAVNHYAKSQRRQTKEGLAHLKRLPTLKQHSTRHLTVRMGSFE